ncbi:hypothetical protein QUB70_22135 [Microcoleus sp. A003_D6]
MPVPQKNNSCGMGILPVPSIDEKDFCKRSNDRLSSNPALTAIEKPCSQNKNKKFSTCAIAN